MSIAPHIAESLVWDRDEVDHVELAEEAEIAKARLIGGNGADISVWSLTLRGAEFGKAAFKALDYGRYNLKPTHVRIDEIRVNPARNHLGMLFGVDAVQRAYPHVERVDVSRFIPAANAALDSVLPHLSDWEVSDEKTGLVPVFALVRRVPELGRH